MPSYKLYYFQARGFAEMSRQLFALSETPYEDIRYSMEDWPNQKSKFTWGKLPVLEVDGVQIPQSAAIARYLGRKFGYAGKTPIEEALVDAWGDRFKDYMFEAAKYFYAARENKPETEELKKTVFIPAVESILGQLRDHLKTSKSGFIVDSGVTWVDLGVADHFFNIKKNHPDIAAKFPEIDAYMHKVQSLPKIKEWIAKRPDTQF